jgi:hypothetical protein
MTLRALHTAILRNAAMLVPASVRAEWLAEWKAELCYVNHDATAFCLGSFRDALWLRRESFSTRRMFSLDSPLRCVLLLTCLAGLSVLLAFPSREQWLPLFSPSGAGQFALAYLGMYLESLLVLLTLNPLGLGEYPANRYAPSLRIRMRRWIFLCAKVSLLVPIPVFLCVALAPIFPPAAWIIFLGWIFGFRWVLADQKQRCPVCLHFLSNPVEVGDPAHMVFRPHTAEATCVRGHGTLFVPLAPATWCSTQRWQYAGYSRR